MMDMTAVIIALRTRALTLSVCTTGSTTLASTTNSYTRLTGSFITDGFFPGQEVKPKTGFSTTDPQIITGVTALTMTIAGTIAADTSNPGKVLEVQLPAARLFMNRAVATTSDKPYITEQFQPATSQTLSMPADTGTLEETGIYTLTWYGLPKYDVGAILKGVDALKQLFAPGTAFSVGSTTVRVRTDVGPFAGQLLPTDDGWVACALTIPWRAWSTNSISP